MATLPQPPSFDERIASLDSLPLFMNSLPEDPTDNVALSALQSLAHEGTPDEIAQNFKEQGNEYFRGKRYREALGFYTQGVDAKPEDGKLREALLLNRAACNLELQNHGSVLRDCAAVISLDPHASKAYYRAGLALLALDRADEALDVCARVGDGAANDAGFKALRERAEKKCAEIRRKADERAERARRASEEKKKMGAAFAARNLIAVPNPDGSANPYAPRFDPEDATGGTLILPVFFLYPEHATSDVVPDFIEDAEFGAVLATMFPPGAPAPPWDVDGRYVVGSLVVYAMTRRKRLLKVGRKMTLRDVCRAAGGTSAGGTNVQDGLEVKDGCLSFVVVPKGEAEQKWVEEYKSTR
ncbi:hypothetical protein EDB92DRAFT_1949214 [Lactarius akahatsu]|uniref:Cns1/TTC4 wheel domain-containing protein n=1 Tax=Lactarius akahatsu TaxID=416441 RepID=A0AAD4LA46_9AGAM|nr:hypothetical protein EDB92DRAFT_1949214 [Lactarius akahatsu]